MTDTIKAKLANSQGIHLCDSLSFYGESFSDKATPNSERSLPLLIINTNNCDAVISLQGAQILQFQPKGEKPWLWLSPHARFEPGKSLRGGIPVCLPWFGVNQQDSQKPKHGFVRTATWQLEQVLNTQNTMQIIFSFSYTGDKPELFGTAFDAQLIIQLSNEIEMTLHIQNKGLQTEDFSWAFHTYFAADNLANVSISGLDQLSYLDNTLGLKTRTQTGDVKFVGEVDSVYQNTAAPQQLIDQLIDQLPSQPPEQRTLEIKGSNCPTCIIWNPGKDSAENMTDVKESYKDFICLERGCAFSDTIQLGAGESFSGKMTISNVHD